MCLGIPGRVVEIDDEENLMGVVDVWGNGCSSTWASP